MRRANISHDPWTEYREAARRGATAQKLHVVAANRTDTQAHTTPASQAQAMRASQVQTMHTSQVQAQKFPLPGSDHRYNRCESGSDCAPLPAHNGLLTVRLQMRRGKTAASGFGPLRQAGLFSGVYVQTEPECVGLTMILQGQLEYAEASGRLLEVEMLSFSRNNAVPEGTS